MSKKIQLSIPTPCHENWEGMTPTEKGKFCGSCQKQVVDFSRMSDRDIAQFFKKPSTGSVCGRFMPEQLGRELEIPQKRIPWLKYFFQVALPALLFSKLSAQKVIGKPTVPLQGDTLRMPAITELKTLGQVTTDCIKPFTEEKKSISAIDMIKGETNSMVAGVSKIITGIVTDENGTAIPGVSIQLKGTQTIVKADEDGFFKISAKQGDVLIAAGVGVEMREFTMNDEKAIQIKMYRLVTGEISVHKTVRPIKNTAIAAKRLLRGRVVNEYGDAIPFASILTGKPGAGVAADESGYFSILFAALSADSLLHISSVGYKTQTVKVKKEDASATEMQAVLKSIYVLPALVLSSDPVILNSLTGVVGGLTVSRYVSKQDSVTPVLKEKVSAISVFPNPAKPGTIINIRMKELQEGDYQVKLLNMVGQLFQTTEISIHKNTQAFPMLLSGVTAGSYFILITDKKTGKKITEKLIIQ